MTKEQLVEDLRNSNHFQVHLLNLGDQPEASTDPQQAVDIQKLIDLFGSLLPMIISALIPGLPAGIAPLIIQIIAQLFGVSFDEARSMVTA